jgi:transposase, IS5 family
MLCPIHLNYLGLSFSQPAPDHSTFSRFRSRLPKQAMDAINSKILRQFEQQGLSINKGVAVDARLVGSASRPLSQDELKKQREHRNTKEGKRDKKSNPLKFSRDLESDWIVKYDTPHFGLKEHTAVDAKHGFVLATTLTPASVNDTNFLAYCTAFSRHTKQKIKKVYADKGYAGKPNRDFLTLNNIEDGIMRKNSTTAKLTRLEIQRNKAISKIRYKVEQYLGISHLHGRANRARFTSIIKKQFDAWFRQAAFNVARGMKTILRAST